MWILKNLGSDGILELREILSFWRIKIGTSGVIRNYLFIGDWFKLHEFL